jgi:hypothetical protein
MFIAASEEFWRGCVSASAETDLVQWLILEGTLPLSSIIPAKAGIHSSPETVFRHYGFPPSRE